jgi:hypothetical protein
MCHTVLSKEGDRIDVKMFDSSEHIFFVVEFSAFDFSQILEVVFKCSGYDQKQSSSSLNQLIFVANQ